MYFLTVNDYATSTKAYKYSTIGEIHNKVDAIVAEYKKKGYSIDIFYDNALVTDDSGTVAVMTWTV